MTPRAVRVLFRGTLLASLLLALAGCDTGVERRDGSVLRPDDAGAPPEAPELDEDPPSVVPWPLVTLRGVARGARRVLVRGGENPIATPVLPDERFCVDIPLPVIQGYTLELLSHGQSGLFSEATAVQTEFDPSAPAGRVVPTCSGADPRGCMGATEICDNLMDDDCDGRADADDPDCATCANDLLEDNDALDGAPRLPPGEYDDLVVCPGDDDYYAVYLRAGESIGATIQFTNADGDLDLMLFDPSGAMVAESRGTGDDETVSHDATTEGEHVVRVYGASASVSTTYRLLLTAM